MFQVETIKDQLNLEGLKYGMSRDVKSLFIFVILIARIVDIEVNDIVWRVEVILNVL